MQIHFFIPLRKIPTVTQQEHKISTRGGKPRIYEPAELRAARQLFRDHLAKHRPDAPLQGPVFLTTKWLFPLAGTHEDGEWKTSKPDTDNLVKLLKDEMTRLKFWKDDAQVAAEMITKHYSKIPGLFIQAVELDVEGVDSDA